MSSLIHCPSRWGRVVKRPKMNLYDYFHFWTVLLIVEKKVLLSILILIFVCRSMWTRERSVRYDVASMALHGALNNRSEFKSTVDTDFDKLLDDFVKFNWELSMIYQILMHSESRKMREEIRWKCYLTYFKNRWKKY